MTGKNFRRIIMIRYILTIVFSLMSVVPCISVSADEKSSEKKILPEWMSNALIIDEKTERDTYQKFCEEFDRQFPKRGTFPKKMSQVALPEDKLPEIIKGHPRMMVRSEPWKYGLSLKELRARAGMEPWASTIKNMAKEYGSTGGRIKKLRWFDGIEAARYFIYTGDDSIVPSLVQWILNIQGPGYGRGGWPFIVYDWICTSEAFTPDLKKKVCLHLIKMAKSAISLQEGGNCGDIWRHRGGGAVDPLCAGFALYGDHPDAKGLLAAGMGYYHAGMLLGRKHSEGAYVGGRVYDGAEHSIPRALYCWASATEEDIFQVVRERYGNWLESRMYYWMSQIFPDKTRPQSSGNDYSPWKPIFSEEEFLITSRAYQNPDGYAFLKWMGRNPKDSILFYDERLISKEPSAVFSGSWSKLWGRDLTGYVQMRSHGWHPDSTVIDFKASKYCGESHGLYSNQNSFYIYHKGRLALHTGIYDSFAKSQHWQHYYRRTISSNSMLIFQPGEFRKDLKEFYQAQGGQWADCFGYKNFTWAEHEWHLKNDPWYDMAQITAYEAAKDFNYTYVSGDATGAYNNTRHVYYRQVRQDGVRKIAANRPKIDLFTRSLVYLPNAGNNLIIFDRVNALEAGYRKAWLLHSIRKPEISGKKTKTEAEGHIEEFDGDLTTVTFGGSDEDICIWKSPAPENGRLFIKTLLPAECRIRRVGGEGCRFRSGGKNWPPLEERRGVWTNVGKGQDAGNWRIEVSPAEPSKFDNFLHLIHICDTRTEKMPPAEMIESEEGKMVGVCAGGGSTELAVKWLILFGKKGETNGEVSYRSPEGKTEHLIVDLKPGAEYNVSPVSSGPGNITASEEGTIRFNTDRETVVRLKPAE